MVYRYTVCLVCLFFLTACVSSPTTNYYQLASVQDALVKELNKQVIVLEPIVIPEVLQRQHIISYGQDQSSLIISSLNLWVSDLSELLSDVSVLTLKASMPASDIFAFPTPKHVDADYRISIRIHELAGRLGGQSRLQAQWFVTDANGNIRINRSENFVRQAEGGGYDQYVQTISYLVADLHNSMVLALAEL